jgi:carboxymethylenebutenolidase
MTDTTPIDAPAPLTVRTPSGPPLGGVVVIQEAFGVNEHIEDLCSRLADAGHLAVAPHLFHRTGDPVFGYDIDFAQIGPHMMALTPEGLAADIDVALEHLAGAGVGRSATGVVGFCMGGTVALWTATRHEIGAAVTFYGGGVAKGRFGLPSLVELAPALRAPWLGLYGDRDTGIPVDEVEQLRAAAAASDQPNEIVRYADAEHGFNCDRRASYHEPSATDAWQRMLSWFGQYLS